MSQLVKSGCSGQSFATLLAALITLCLSTPLHSVTASAADLTGDSAYLGRSDPLLPVQIGPREQVGKPSLGEKAAASAIGGLMSSVLGGSNRKSSKPKTRRDPTRKQAYNNLAVENFDTETQARGQWTKEGLLISSRIEESPGKGTFQSLFLESCDGRRLYPQRYDIYDLWNESSLSVSWSSTSTSNGNVVSQKSGGWSETWNDNSAIDDSLVGESTEAPGTWQQLGFDRAQGGVRQIGAYFNLTAAELASMGEVGLFIHSSRPLLDPVTTAPVHWLIGPGTDEHPQLITPVQADSTTGNQQQWQNASAVCRQQNALLLASATAIPLAVGAGVAGLSAVVKKGYPVPVGLKIRVTGTGQTTGHIADLTITSSDGDEWPTDIPAQSFYIPSDGRYQSYVAKPVQLGNLAGAGPHTIPIYGYCGDVHLPPVPAGVELPPPSEWIVVTGPVENINIPSRPGSLAAGRALIPGTDIAIPRAIDASQEPLLTAPLLLAAMDEIERKTTELQASGDLRTPFTGNEQRERDAVVQQTIWMYAAELEGEPYTQEDFTQRLEQQFEDRSGIPITAATPEDQERLQQGADDFWGAFELVGLEAKIISHRDVAAPASGAAAETELKPAPIPGTAAAPPPEKVATGCVSSEHIHHSPRQANVVIADSYGDDDSRKKIIAGIKKAVESEDNAYVTTTPPSTAYSIWRDDSIGGISSAYAKSVFLEKNSQDWVWSTDPMKTTARGSGIHTLSFKPGPGCTATVAGAALMWMKSSSHAFDPLANSIEVFRALDAIKEVSVEYVTGKLPPGISDAADAGVDAITDPASDTYAAAMGSSTLQVGGQTDGGTSSNRVDYKRKDKEDKAITGGGASVTKLFASDVRPNALSSKIDAAVVMEAGATGNGLAKAWLESFYGTLLVGVCECPGSVSYEILTDTSQFIRTDAAKGAVDVAMRDMKAVVDRIGKDIESGEQKTDGDDLKKRVEGELRNWGNGNAGQRFKPAEPASDK